MKNSAWYHKIWLTKHSELPLKEEADSAWNGMSQLLDVEMPLNSTSTSAKPSGTSLLSYFSYFIAAAAVIGSVTYFALTNPDERKKNKAAMRPDTTIVSEATVSDSTTASGAMVSDSTFSSDNFNAPAIDSVVKKNSAQKTDSTPLMDQNNLLVNKSIDSANEATILTAKPFDNQAKTAAFKAKYATLAIKPIKQKEAKVSWFKRLIGLYRKDLQKSPKLIDQKDSVNKSRIKIGKKKKLSDPITTPPYNFGLELGLNQSNGEQTIYIGAFGTYAINNKLMINGGLRSNTARTFIGEYTRANFFKPDSLPAISFTDSRTVMTLDVPINLEYKISQSVSIKAGPVLSFLMKQNEIKLGPITNPSDTIMRKKEIYGVLNNTKMNKINYGFSTGISYHFRRFDLDARYQLMTPFNWSNDYGSNKLKNHTFQFGIGYRFK